MTEGIGHNSERPRKDIIRELRDGLAEVKEKMASLGEVRKTLKGRIKSDLGMKVADWDIMIRLIELEEDDRTELGKVIREGFDALHPGQQATFLDALDPKPTATKARRKTKAEQIAEAVLADSQPTAEQQEIEQQRAEDDEAFDQSAGDELADEEELEEA